MATLQKVHAKRQTQRIKDLLDKTASSIISPNKLNNMVFRGPVPAEPSSSLFGVLRNAKSGDGGI